MKDNNAENEKLVGLVLAVPNPTARARKWLDSREKERGDWTYHDRMLVFDLLGEYAKDIVSMRRELKPSDRDAGMVGVIGREKWAEEAREREQREWTVESRTWAESNASEGKYAEDACDALGLAMGAVLADRIDDGYQGSVDVLMWFAHQGVWLYLQWTWGSCSACDSWDGMSDDEMRDEFRQLAMRMNDSAFQSWVGMLERTKDPKGAVFQRAINLRDETRNDKPLRVPALNELN